MNKKAIIFITLLMSIFLYRAAVAEEWDLKTCLDIGLKQNPTLRAALKGIDAAEARVKQNQSAYYPFLFVETDYNRFDNQSSLNSITSLNQGPNELTTYFFGVSQNIYDFGRREYKVQTSKEDLKTFQWSLRDVRLTVIDNIRQAYYGVLLSQRALKVSQEDLKRTRDHFLQAQGFYQVGLKAKIDVTQAEVTVITAQKALLQAESNVQLAWVTLAAAMGLEQPNGHTLKDDLEGGRVDWKLEDLQKEALEKDPLLNRLRVIVKFWEAQEQEAKSEFWPTLTGTARYGWNNGTNYSNDETWNVGLQLNLPIFSGFLRRSKLAEIRASLSQAKANEEIQRLQVISNLQNQYLNLGLAEKQIDVAKESLRSASENLDLAEGRYKAGVGSMLDVTDARSSFLQAETDYNQAFYNNITARYKVDRAVGRESF